MSQIEDFLTAWKPGAAFEKQLQSDLYQFKYSPRHGSGARAFSGHFQGNAHDIALVLTAYKKSNEAKFLAKQTAYNGRARQLNGVLTDRTASEIEDWLRVQRNDDTRRVVTDADIGAG